MPLIVETGLGLNNAESYCSLAYAASYHTSMANSAWDAIDADVQEAYLRRATRFMVSQYRSRWLGTRAVAGQALDWPRANVSLADTFDGYLAHNVVPLAIQQACAEFALRASTGALLEDLERKTLSESLGALSVTYDPNAPVKKQYAEVEGLLAPFLGQSGNMIRLDRA